MRLARWFGVATALALGCGGDVFVDGQAGGAGSVARGTTTLHATNSGPSSENATTLATSSTLAQSNASMTQLASATTSGSGGAKSSSEATTAVAVGSSSESEASSTGSASGCTRSSSCEYPSNTCCGNACVDATNDPLNCGRCGKICPADKPICGAPVDSAERGCATIEQACERTTACPAGKTCCHAACCDDTERCCLLGYARGASDFGCIPLTAGTCPPHQDIEGMDREPSH